MNVRRLHSLIGDAIVSQYNAMRGDAARALLKLVLHTQAVPSSHAAINVLDVVASTNAIVAEYEAHRVSVFSASTGLGAHGSSDATNAVTSAVATNLATSITRANELKTDLNAHISVTAKHIAASSAAVAAAAAEDEPTLLVLLADIRAVLLAHTASAFTSEPLVLVNP